MRSGLRVQAPRLPHTWLARVLPSSFPRTALKPSDPTPVLVPHDRWEAWGGSPGCS